MYHIPEQHVEFQEGIGSWRAPASSQEPSGIVKDGFNDGHQACTTSR